MKFKMRGFMKGFFLAAILFSFICAESQQKPPQNYIGGLIVVDVTYTSIGGALEYERWLLVKNKWVLSAKADYVFPHKTINLIWPFNDLGKSNSEFCVMASGYYFSGRKNEPQGFFAGASAGLSRTQYEEEVDNDYTGLHIEKSSVISPACEFFVGGQTNFRRGGSIRATLGTYQFFSHKGNEYPQALPIVLLFMKLSFGF